MNYLKSAIAGIGVGVIGTSLCGTTMGVLEDDGYATKTKYHFMRNDTEDLRKTYNVFFANGRHDWSKFKLREYYNDYLKPNENNGWVPKSFIDGICEKEWSVATSFILNGAYCIPSALLGAAFHEKYSQSLTEKVNSLFDSKLSSYLVTGGVFGLIGTIGEAIDVICTSHYVRSDLTLPWIYSVAIMRGFIVGIAATAGAYFGDEEEVQPEVVDNCQLIDT